jgi:hypothetical protein
VRYEVKYSLEAVEDVLRIAIASQVKSAVVNASNQLKEVLKDNPAEAGEHLSEGLYAIDYGPLRAFFLINVDELSVEIVNVKQA